MNEFISIIEKIWAFVPVFISTISLIILAVIFIRMFFEWVTSKSHYFPYEAIMAFSIAYAALKLAGKA